MLRTQFLCGTESSSTLATWKGPRRTLAGFPALARPRDLPPFELTAVSSQLAGLPQNSTRRSERTRRSTVVWRDLVAARWRRGEPHDRDYVAAANRGNDGELPGQGAGDRRVAFRQLRADFRHRPHRDRWQRAERRFRACGSSANPKWLGSCCQPCHNVARPAGSTTRSAAAVDSPPCGRSSPACPECRTSSLST